MIDEIAWNAEDFADYINNYVLKKERLTTFGVLDALAFLQLKIVDDPSRESKVQFDKIRADSVGG